MFVSSLWIYPVKSLGAQPLQRVVVEPRGLCGDRRFMLVDEAGNFITQREFPHLTLIRAQLNNETLELRNGSQTLQVDGHVKASRCRVTVWNDTVDAVDMGDDAASILSAWIGKNVRLVYMGDDTQRVVDQQYGKPGDMVSFADGFPVLLIGEDSLQAFNTKLSSPIEMLNFRPNIVVSGASAFAEDEWKRVRIGDIIFDVVKPCSRCVVPSINIHSGEKMPGVIAALARHRRRDDGKTCFGQNLIARNFGEMALGADVEILE